MATYLDSQGREYRCEHLFEDTSRWCIECYYEAAHRTDESGGRGVGERYTRYVRGVGHCLALDHASGQSRLQAVRHVGHRPGELAVPREVRGHVSMHEAAQGQRGCRGHDDIDSKNRR